MLKVNIHGEYIVSCVWNEGKTIDYDRNILASIGRIIYRTEPNMIPLQDQHIGYVALMDATNLYSSWTIMGKHLWKVKDFIWSMLSAWI